MFSLGMNACLNSCTSAHCHMMSCAFSKKSNMLYVLYVWQQSKLVFFNIWSSTCQHFVKEPVGPVVFLSRTVCSVLAVHTNFTTWALWSVKHLLICVDIQLNIHCSVNSSCRFRPVNFYTCLEIPRAGYLPYPIISKVCLPFRRWFEYFRMM